MTLKSCSWCHTLNPSAARTCSRCQHNPAVPRLACDCANCGASRRIVDFALRQLQVVAVEVESIDLPPEFLSMLPDLGEDN